MKKTGYCCPYCSSHLDVNEKIILSAKSASGKRGLLLLSAVLGDYSISKNESFELQAQEKLELSCSVCHHDLTHDSHQNLSKIIHINEALEETTILFSNVFGEHCTLMIADEKQQSYGEMAIRFQDPEWYLQD